MVECSNKRRGRDKDEDAPRFSSWIYLFTGLASFRAFSSGVSVRPRL